MKVTHYSFSRTGGAGRVAETLATSQKRIGIEADFEYLIERSLREEPLKRLDLTLAAAFDEFLVKRREVPTTFSLARARFGKDDLPAGSLGFQNDILHLHWNEGVFSLKFLSRYLKSGGRLVWTLHDMAPFTGGCHHSLSCDLFSVNCSNCPQVRKVFQKSVSVQLSRKQDLFRTNLRNLRLVAPSDWIRGLANNAGPLGEIDVQVIQNPIDRIFFEAPTSTEHKIIASQKPSFVCVVVAEDLSDPVKRVKHFIHLVKTNSQMLNGSIKIYLVGRNGEEMAQGDPDIASFGTLTPLQLVKVLDSADLLISFSSAESAGMTIKEAAARGTPSLVFGNPGTASTVRKDQTAFTADTVADFLQQLANFTFDKSALKNVGVMAQQDSRLENHPDIVAAKYKLAYQELLTRD